nr:hypothetical protein CFP56_78530 [Quercus suber]
MSAEDYTGYRFEAAVICALFCSITAVLLRYLARRIQHMESYSEDYLVWVGLALKIGLDGAGITNNEVDAALWTTIEPAAAIITVCIPSVRSLYRTTRESARSVRMSKSLPANITSANKEKIRTWMTSSAGASQHGSSSLDRATRADPLSWNRSVGFSEFTENDVSSHVGRTSSTYSMTTQEVGHGSAQRLCMEPGVDMCNSFDANDLSRRDEHADDGKASGRDCPSALGENKTTPIGIAY